MRRYLILLFIIVACIPLYGAGPLFTQQAGMVIAGSETYLFKYDADHSSGTDYAYTNSGAGSVQGTFTDTTASSDQNHTSGGLYSLLSGAGGERITFTQSGVDTAEGSVELWYYIDAADISGGGNDIFEIYNSSNAASDMIRASINSTGNIYFRHEGNNAVVSFTTTGTVSCFQGWQRLRFRWSVTNNQTGVQIGVANWEIDNDDTVVTAFSGSQDTIVFGNGVYGSESSTDNHYIDDYEIINEYNTFND